MLLWSIGTVGNYIFVYEVLWLPPKGSCKVDPWLNHLLSSPLQVLQITANIKAFLTSFSNYCTQVGHFCLFLHFVQFGPWWRTSVKARDEEVWVFLWFTMFCHLSIDTKLIMMCICHQTAFGGFNNVYIVII